MRRTDQEIDKLFEGLDVLLGNRARGAQLDREAVRKGDLKALDDTLKALTASVALNTLTITQGEGHTIFRLGALQIIYMTGLILTIGTTTSEALSLAVVWPQPFTQDPAVVAMLPNSTVDYENIPDRAVLGALLTPLGADRGGLQLRKAAGAADFASNARITNVRMLALGLAEDGL